MGMEQTLIILKPDAVKRALMGRIITRFEEKGLCVVAAKMMKITPEILKVLDQLIPRTKVVLN